MIMINSIQPFQIELVRLTVKQVYFINTIFINTFYYRFVIDFIVVVVLYSY